MKASFVILSVSILVAVALGGIIPSYHHGLDNYGHSSDLLLHEGGHFIGHDHKVIVPVVKHVSVVKKVPVVKTVPVIKHVPVVKHVSVVKHVNVVKKVPVVKHITYDLGHHIDDHGLNLHGHGLHGLGGHHGLHSLHGLHGHDLLSHKTFSHHY